MISLHPIPDGVAKTGRDLLPLPLGEGRGEGSLHFASHPLCT